MKKGNHYTYNGELQALRIFVTTRLLWNPYCDLDALVDDFTQVLYSSAPYIRQCFDLLNSKIRNNTHMTPFTYSDNSYYGGDFVSETLATLKIIENILIMKNL